MEKKIPVNTITRDIKNLAAPTGNIYETVVILSRRANQIALAEKKELNKKLEDSCFFPYSTPMFMRPMNVSPSRIS